MNKKNYLALGGLFITLHLLFIFLSRILAGSELILVIFLPLLSTIYALNFNKKEVTMFFIATFLLCVIFEPIATLIYVLPSLICGTVYGILSKYRVKELSLVYISSLSHSLSLLVSFLSISLMFKEVNFFEIFKSFIDKQGESFYVSVYLILLVLGVLEAFVLHIITSSELKRLGYEEIESENETPIWMNIGLGFSLIIYTILAIINPIFSCYAFPFVIAFLTPIIVEFVMLNRYKWIYFIMGILFIGIIFVIRYVNVVFYPLLLLSVFLPIILEKIVRVLYTNSSKYLNNGQNKIE